jgi:hypothetical protein
MDTRFIALKCLEMALNNGSQVARQNYLERAQEMYDWVTSKKTVQATTKQATTPKE